MIEPSTGEHKMKINLQTFTSIDAASDKKMIRLMMGYSAYMIEELDGTFTVIWHD